MTNSPTPSAQTVIDELMEARAKASPDGGIWRACEYTRAETGEWLVMKPDGEDLSLMNQEEAVFVALAHTRLPALAEEMTRVLARLEAAEAERDTYKRGYEGREKAKQMWFKKAEERAREIESLQSSLSAIAKSADDTEKALEASHSLWRKHAENCGVDPEGLTEIGCLDLVEQEVASLQSSLSAETAARQQSEERARELALNLWHLATNNNPHRWTGHEGERWFDCYGVGNYLKDAIDHLYKLGVLEKLPAGHWYRLLPQEAETKEVKG